jgi:hypothetical protein
VRGVHDIAQGEWGDGALALAFTGPGAMALQADGYADLFGRFQRGTIWRHLGVLTTTCFGAFVGFVGEGVFARFTIDQDMAGRTSATDLIQRWELDPT